MLVAIYASRPCPRPEKKRYASQDEAYVAADFIFDTSGTSLEPYCCACGLWHLATPKDNRGQSPADDPPINGTKAARRRRRSQPPGANRKANRRPRPD